MEARTTLPQALRAALAAGEPKTLSDLSRELGVSEKSLPDAMSKLARSAVRAGSRLCQLPASCLECGFEFRDRERVTSPSRCARCRSERITSPKFWLETPAKRS